MALKTIYGYKDVDFGFTPIEDADYTETNVVQKYDVINSSLEKANTVLSKFLEVCGDINDQLSSIGNTGIESTELDATFQTIGNYLHNAQFQLETSNKEFDKLTTEELEEIAAANRAAQEALEQATGYGQRADTDHSKKAYDYIMSVPGFAEIFGQIQSTVEAGVEKVNNSVREFTDSVKNNVRSNTFVTGGEKVDRPYTDYVGSNDYETTAIGLANPSVTNKPTYNVIPEFYEKIQSGEYKVDPNIYIQKMDLPTGTASAKPISGVKFDTQAIGLANPSGDATTKRFQQEVLSLNSLQKSLDQDLAAFAKK